MASSSPPVVGVLAWEALAVGEFENTGRVGRVQRVGADAQVVGDRVDVIRRRFATALIGGAGAQRGPPMEACLVRPWSSMVDDALHR